MARASSIPEPSSSPHPSEVRLGVSACLIGEHTRYDGQHKQEALLTEHIGRFVTFVPMCPEVEAGLGVPRPAMHLEGTPERPRLVVNEGGADRTDELQRHAVHLARKSEEAGLSGFILKSRSPSCGLRSVKLRQGKHPPSRRGVGLFARALTKRLAMLPIEEEARLQQPEQAITFMEQVFTRARWICHCRNHNGRRALLAFHASHRHQLAARGSKILSRLEALLDDPTLRGPSLLGRYGQCFAESIKRPASKRAHLRLLRKIQAALAPQINEQDSGDIDRAVRDFERGAVPLLVPIFLLKHQCVVAGAQALAEQSYLEPLPQELWLRLQLALPVGSPTHQKACQDVLR